VGHLAVASPQSSDSLFKRRINALDQGVPYRDLDADELTVLYPHLKFAPGSTAILEDSGAGYISPRSLLKAQVEAAKALGCCQIIPHVASRVENNVSDDGEASFVVTLSNGEVISAKRILVCTGAFCDARLLLPDGNGGHFELDLLRYTAQTIHFHVSEKDATDLLEGGMPSIIYRGDKSEWAYVLPPIQYPDGSWRVKLGGSRVDRYNNEEQIDKYRTPGTRSLPTHEHVVEWFRSAGNSKDFDEMKEMLQAMLPGIQPVKVTSDACATCKTSSGRPYIGQLCDGLFVAVGGCGLAAKSSDEIGRLAAFAALSDTGWGLDESLGEELFTPRLK